jgi:multidrug efflux pump subunit AcrA (membrane-fusion protein)
MEECVDAGDICSIQFAKNGPEGVSTGHILHKQWHSDSANASVASIPLQVDDKIVAILSLRHTPGQSFTPEQLEKVRELATPLIPGAMLLDRADRKLVDHAKSAAIEWIIQQLSQDTWVRRIGFGVALASLCLVILGKQTYMLTLPCTVAPADEREISAPFEGVIEATLVRAGDTVEEGQLLARLDTRQLRLDLNKANSDYHAASIESIQGASEGDLQKLAIGRAKADAAKSLAQKIERNLQLAEVRAPCKGTILTGDLDKRIGESVPMGESLFRFAAADKWKIVIDSPEFATSLIDVGQKGNFATVARPLVPLNVEVDHLRTHAEVRDGKNVFLSEANLSCATLSGAILNNAKLERAILIDADLNGVSLRSAIMADVKASRVQMQSTDLTDVKLTRADLSRANLSGAIMIRANLIEAYLARTNLAKADLTDSILNRAELSSANIVGAILKGATLPDGKVHK